MRRFLSCIPIYENPRTLEFQVDSLNRFDTKTKSSIELVVVDDGSPNYPAHACRVEPEFDMKIFRVGKDRPWNHRAARNIGAHEASNEWLFLLDMDALVPEATISELIGLSTEEHNWYLFFRRDARTLQPRGRHHDTILISRELYWRIGGFDENFAGIYGAGPIFSKSLEKIHPWIHLKDLWVDHISPDFLPDARTQGMRRKASLLQRITLHWLKFALHMNLVRRKVLQQDYERTL